METHTHVYMYLHIIHTFISRCVERVKGKGYSYSVYNFNPICENPFLVFGVGSQKETNT